MVSLLYTAQHWFFFGVLIFGWPDLHLRSVAGLEMDRNVMLLKGSPRFFEHQQCRLVTFEHKEKHLPEYFYSLVDPLHDLNGRPMY